VSEILANFLAALDALENGSPADLATAGPAMRAFLRRNPIFANDRAEQSRLLLDALRRNDFEVIRDLERSPFEEISKQARIEIFKRENDLR
jgi:hypothetical protein